MLDKSGAHELSVHRKFFPAFAQAQFCFCSGNFALLLLRPENFVSTFRGERKGGGGGMAGCDGLKYNLFQILCANPFRCCDLVAQAVLLASAHLAWCILRGI